MDKLDVHVIVRTYHAEIFVSACDEIAVEDITDFIVWQGTAIDKSLEELLREIEKENERLTGLRDTKNTRIGDLNGYHRTITSLRSKLSSIVHPR